MTVAEIDFNILAHAGHPLAKFAPGEIIFAAGDRGDKMYVIRSGEVENPDPPRQAGSSSRQETFSAAKVLWAVPSSSDASQAAMSSSGRQRRSPDRSPTTHCSLGSSQPHHELPLRQSSSGSGARTPDPCVSAARPACASLSGSVVSKSNRR